MNKKNPDSINPIPKKRKQTVLRTKIQPNRAKILNNTTQSKQLKPQERPKQVKSTVKSSAKPILQKTSPNNSSLNQDLLRAVRRLLGQFKDWGDYDTADYVVKKVFQNGKHAELVVLLEHPETKARVIKKRYKRDNLNIFYNEVLQLSKLVKCSFAPTLLKVRPERRTLYMSYCGPPIKMDKLSQYEEQIEKYKKELRTKWKIYHNDLKPGNICLLGKRIYFIDFGWASHKKLKAGYGKGRAGYQNQRLFIPKN